MKNKLFIGGLNYKTTEGGLRERLLEFGEVLSIRIVTDHETGRSRGFAFATFATEEDAEKAIQELDNQQFEGRRIGVKHANDRRK